jgi:SAM-dependent methyltransferase
VSKHSSQPPTLSRILEARREFVAGQLNSVCIDNESPRILSVGNGTVREAESALKLCREAGGMFVVLDGTGEPPDIFRLDYPNPCARYITYPFGAIPSPENIGQFDFVYALNLLNELDGRRARQMLTSLLAVVRPGGRLLLSNFTREFPNPAAAGFYRSEEELAQLLPSSAEQAIVGHAIWRDDSRGVLYLEIERAELVSGCRAPRLSFLHQENQWYQ